MADITTDVMLVGTSPAGPAAAALLASSGVETLIINRCRWLATTRRDFEDHAGDWARAREISDGGCLLVRPDHHAGWRAFASSKSAEKDHSTALKKILGH